MIMGAAMAISFAAWAGSMPLDLLTPCVTADCRSPNTCRRMPCPGAVSPRPRKPPTSSSRPPSWSFWSALSSAVAPCGCAAFFARPARIMGSAAPSADCVAFSSAPTALLSAPRLPPPSWPMSISIIEDIVPPFVGSPGRPLGTSVRRVRPRRGRPYPQTLNGAFRSHSGVCLTCIRTSSRRRRSRPRAAHRAGTHSPSG